MNMKQKTWVCAGQWGWISTDEVEFSDIEEGPFGDVMSFKFCGESFKSQIAVGSKPGA
jgi:hypothetical protein